MGQNSYMQGILPDGIRPTQFGAKLCRLIAAPHSAWHSIDAEMTEFKP